MKSSTSRLVAGLALALLLIGAYAAYTLRSVARLREVQTSVIDRNRLASLQLIRIQNDLNALGLALRDILDGHGEYPPSAWRAPLNRIRTSLQDAIQREELLSGGGSDAQQAVYLRSSFDQFWAASDRMFTASASDPKAARKQVRDELQPRVEALSSTTSRLLVLNNDREARAADEVRAVYQRIEWNAYWLLALSVALILAAGLTAIRFHRQLFARLESLADERRELARQLIATQESTFRSISRDLHDEFGQVLTAVGAMTRRAERLAPSSSFHGQLQELKEIVQQTLEKIRALSQSLQPVILEEQGLREAVAWHLMSFQRQTGIRVHSQLGDEQWQLPATSEIHVFRILQEALNNVARHAAATEVAVTIENRGAAIHLTVEDRGVGFNSSARRGLGLAGMRERAELIGGELRVTAVAPSGTRVSLTVPVPARKEAAIA
jgi:signal transduction histidine kinase